VEPSRREAWIRALRRPRNLVLLGVAVLLVAFRVALPYAVRSVAVSQADAALVGRIELDDVSLSLLRLGVELNGLRVFADELPASPTAGTEAAPPPGEPPVPLATIGRLWLRVGWLPLFSKTVDLAELELDDFTVRLDRAADGALVLPQPVPSDAPPEPEPEADEGPGWALLVSSVHLRNGQVGFRDFAVSAEPEPFELRIDDVVAEKLAILVTSEGLAPGRLQLQADVEGGKLTVDSQVEMRAKGPKADTRVDLRDLPIARSRLYLGQLGWSDLQGILDVQLQHAFEMDGPHHVSGNLALRDVAVMAPGFEGRSAAFSRLDVAVGDVDLVASRARIDRVTLDGLRLPVRPNDPKPLPLLQSLLSVDEAGAAPPAAGGAAAVASPARAPAPARPGTEGAAAPAAKPAENAPPPAEQDGADFAWTIGEIRFTDALLALLRDGQTTPLGVEAAVRGVSSDPAAPMELDLKLAPPGGRIDLTGALVLQPRGFDGRLVVAGVDLPKLLAPIDQPAVSLVRRGVLDVDWKVAAGPAAGGPAGVDARAVRIAGPLRLADLELTDPAGAKDFRVAWKELAIDVAEIYAMGVLPAPEAAGAPASTSAGARGRGAEKPAGPPPPRLVIERFRLVQPEVRVARTEAGIVLPAALGGTPAPEAPAKANAAATPAGPTAVAAQPAAAAPEPPAPVDLRIAKLSLERGRIEIEDRTVKPFFRNQIHPLDVSATDVRYPGPSVGKLSVDARTSAGGKLALRGSVAKDAVQIDAKLDDLPLSPFNPYAAGTGYGLGGGSASLESKFRLQGEKYDANTKVLVKQLEVKGDQGESLFQQQFGIPLSVALALLKDLEGNITLDVPLAGDRSGTRIALGSIVGQALAKAIVGAITSPLKMISAVAEMGGKIENVAPQAISFRPGRAELAEGEEGRLDALAALLGRSPGLAITLHGVAGAEDARWLREQALRAEIERTSGVVGSVRHLGERNERRVALEVLEKRANDKSAAVPDEVLEWFERHVREQRLEPGALERLATARVDAIRTLLSEQHGVAAERLPVAPPEASESAEAAPAVALALGAAGRSAPPAAASAAGATPGP